MSTNGGIDLTGSWRAVYAELNGEMTSADHFSGIVMSYDDDSFSIEVNGEVAHEGTYAIDESTDPAQITYTYSKSTFYETGKPRVGIVQLVGATFKDCLGAIGDPPPPSFNTTADSNTVMTVHARSGSESGLEIARISPEKTVSQW
jgi:uncharacterized protein (TIGR03067 family)